MTGYLKLYNLIAFCFWLVYLVLFITSGLSLNNTNVLLLNIAQGLAVLEIVHALFGWVKSPVASTVAQVLSRLLVLVIINIYYNTPTHPIFEYGLITISLAWSITELVRYSYYFFLLHQRELKWLTWMRYSLFIALYPLGVTGEWLVICAPIVAVGFTLRFYTVAAIIVAASYMYYFPVLYGYMWKQRSKKVT